MPHALRQKFRIDVADQDHVVLEHLLSIDRKAAKGCFILRDIIGIGVLQKSGELNRVVALEQRFQEPEFVVGVALYQEDADLVVSNHDFADLSVVLLVRFIVAERDLDDIRHLARLRRPIDEPDGLGFTVCRKRDVLLDDGLSNAFATERDFSSLPLETAGFDLCLNADQIIGEHHIVHEHVRKLNIARR